MEDIGELLVVILFIVFSVISSIKKKNQQSNSEITDMDFSDVVSENDFSNKKGKRKRSYDPNLTTNNSLPNAFSGESYKPTNSLATFSNSKKELTQKNLEKIENQITQTKKEKEAIKINEAKLAQENKDQDASIISFQKEDLLKAFVMNELMQRYDLNKIYDRIPYFNKDE